MISSYKVLHLYSSLDYIAVGKPEPVKWRISYGVAEACEESGLRFTRR